jgi:hypothetical protein
MGPFVLVFSLDDNVFISINLEHNFLFSMLLKLNVLYSMNSFGVLRLLYCHFHHLLVRHLRFDIRLFVFNLKKVVIFFCIVICLLFTLICLRLGCLLSLSFLLHQVCLFFFLLLRRFLLLLQEHVFILCDSHLLFFLLFLFNFSFQNLFFRFLRSFLLL